jgi:hypothetical protein
MGAAKKTQILFLTLSLIVSLLLTFTSVAISEEAKKGPPEVFPGFKSVGQLSKAERADYYKRIGQNKKAAIRALGQGRPFEHTEHQIGYLPFSTSPATLQDITPGHAAQADVTLTSVDIRVDRLRVLEYPGWGSSHKVMFTFKAQNSLTDQQGEGITFNQTYVVEEGEGAGIAGYPVFIGLNVGKQGAAFQLATINVASSGDEKALAVMQSKEFQNGLALLTTAQPAIQPFTALGTGIAEMILSRSNNKKVQDVYLGLDFETGAAYGVRLAIGNYIVVQAPYENFKWEDWTYDSANGRIVKKREPDKTIPFNYFIFRVSKHSS